MTANNEFGRLLLDLWGDLQQAEMLWQIGVLLVCLGLAWLFDALVRRRQTAREPATSKAAQLGQRGLKRIAFPLSALVLVLVARALLSHWHHVNLLSLAVPLLASLVVIRSVFFVLRLSFKGPWLQLFERIFGALAWGIVALHITGLLPDLINLLEGVQTAGYFTTMGYPMPVRQVMLGLNWTFFD